MVDNRTRSAGSEPRAAAPHSLADQDGIIWADGVLKPWRECTLHMLSLTAQHGFGVFEGVRAYRTSDGEHALFRLQDHTARLFRSARMLNIEIPFSEEEINEAHLEVIRANALGDCYLRPFVYLGGERPGLSAAGNSIHVAIAAWVWNAFLGDAAKAEGIRLKTSSFARPSGNSTMMKAKSTGNYIVSIMAHDEARLCGFDDALMFDTEGKVSEASAANLFLVRDGRVITPNSTAILEGITRDSVMRLCADLGYSVGAREVSREDVYAADELFITGTAAEVTPVREIDGRKVGDGRPGPITRSVQDAFEKAVTGAAGTSRGWLTRF